MTQTQKNALQTWKRNWLIPLGATILATALVLTGCQGFFQTPEPVQTQTVPETHPGTSPGQGQTEPQPKPQPQPQPQQPPAQVVSDILNGAAGPVGIVNPTAGLVLLGISNLLTGLVALRKKQESDQKQEALEHLNTRSSDGLYQNATDPAVKITLEKFIGT